MPQSNHAPWSTFFQLDAFNVTGEKLMGRQAAGFSYIKALAENNYDTLSFFVRDKSEHEKVISLLKPLLKRKTDLNFIPWSNPGLSEKFGGIFIPEPKLGMHALLRSKFGHHSHSIVGITHTTASDSVMDSVADYIVKPVKPWDAIICTSKCVKDTLTMILENQKDFLKFELNADKFELPQLPIIPLGINNNEFNYDQPFRDDVRSSLGLKENDIAIIFVGRLSFHAKSHHFPMFAALNELSKKIKNGGKIHLLLTGWFGNDNIKKIFVDEHKLISPDIICHLIDGRDQQNKYKTFAAGDIFMSLSDNFQETFGLTPLEAMSSGLPVVVSDWNGYRETVRNEKDGFTVKTKSLPKGSGEDLMYNYRRGIYNYDHYIGYTSQLVSVDIDDCIHSLEKLIFSKDLRIKMGKSGKERAVKNFEWKNILKQYSDLNEELNDIRLKSKDNSSSKSLQSGINIDPFLLFESYPSSVITLKSEVKKSNTINDLGVNDILNLGSVSFALNGPNNQNNLIDKKNILKIYSILPNDFIKIEKLIKELNIDESNLLKSIIWMSKYSLLKFKD